MIEVLPIKLLTDEDSQIFGSLNVALGKLDRAELPVAQAIVVTAPDLHLKTILEHYDVLPKAKGKVLQASSTIFNTASEAGSYFGSKEIFEQSLILVRREIHKTPIPEVFKKEVGNHNQFLLNGQKVKSVKDLWLSLLTIWIEQIKQRLWMGGFYKGIAEGLDPQVVIFVNMPEAYGSAYYDNLQDDTAINVRQGKLHPNDLKKLDELVKTANKKLFMPHEYEWVVDGGVKLTKVLPYTPSSVILSASEGSPTNVSLTYVRDSSPSVQNDNKSAVKIFLDLSHGLVIVREGDGVYIAAEKIFDLNKPRESLEDLILKVVDSATTFPDKPILFKLADKSEGMGKVRGTLRLLHQQSLLQPMIDALDFIRHKKGLSNVHIVIPFVRTIREFLQIKRELTVKKLVRKHSLEIWMEAAVPENILNLENYLEAGVDGVILNLDELVAHLNGFDLNHEELVTYKNEVEGLLKFLEDGIRLLHKVKIPFIAHGSLTLNPQVLEYLVEKGIYGVVVERYEAPSAKDLLHQVERSVILKN